MPRLHGRARRRPRHSHVRSLCPCCATTVLWSDSAVFRAGSAVAVHRRSSPSFRTAEADPHGPDFSAAYGVSSVAVRFQVVDALVAHGVLYMPVVAQRQLLMVQITSRLSPYSALFGSTLDTCLRLEVLEDFHLFSSSRWTSDPEVDAWCSRIHHNAWFVSGSGRWLLGVFRFPRIAWFDSGSGR